ncbi:MAG: YraN family protein [Propionibacterium sp.]|nr:MAG: YraN family protein [Propionibacterium sp.]
MSSHLILGETGEDIAAQYLANQGYEILQRNWRCKIGEIDIIALDGDEVVFVEVKCRSGKGFGDPLEAITYAKMAKIRQLAAIWLRECDIYIPSARIDGIGVLKIRGSSPRITHIARIG